VRIACHHGPFTATILTNFVVEKSQQHNGCVAGGCWSETTLWRDGSFVNYLSLVLTTFDVRRMWWSTAWRSLMRRPCHIAGLKTSNWCMAAYTLVFRGCRCRQHVLRAVVSDDLNDSINLMDFDLQQALMLKCRCGQSTCNDWWYVRWEDDVGAVAVQIVMWIRRWYARSTYSLESIAVLDYREDSGFGVHLHKVIAKRWYWKLATPYL
jgi:hypothetical protein